MLHRICKIRKGTVLAKKRSKHCFEASEEREEMCSVNEKEDRHFKFGSLKTILAGVLIVLSVSAVVNVVCQMVDFLDRVAHPLYYYEYIESYSEKYGVPQSVICAVINTESSFISDAVSSAGAMGLMQITPDTFTWLMSKTDEEYDKDMLLEPEINIKYGSYFLSVLYENFGDWNVVYAAYNAGMNRVRGWLDDPEIYESGKLKNIPIKETRDYVQKVTNDVDDYRRLYSELLDE